MDQTQMMLLELGSKNYSCAQILLIGGLRLTGNDNPDLVRAMGGLAEGMGFGSTCGAFTGGACLIGLYTGKGHDDEFPLENSALIMEEYTSWFRETFCKANPATSCDGFLGLDDANAPRLMQPARCGAMIGQVWERVISLLAENGIDPTTGR